MSTPLSYSTVIRYTTLFRSSPSHQVEPEAESENSRSAALIATLLTVAVLLIGTVVWAGISATGESQGEITPRSEEHTSELQSRGHLVCRLLLGRKKKIVHCE